MQESLFHQQPIHLLTYDGAAVYVDHFLSSAEADACFRYFLTHTPWQNDMVSMFGKTIITSRKTAWYSEQLKEYTYSKQAHRALPFDDTLHQLRKKIEQLTGATYNACLLNLYENGTQGMGWHQDDEAEIVPQSSIASVSLGAARPFQFRHIRNNETVKLMLHHGSLLNMYGPIQHFWKHQLPKALKVKEPRINITFRHML
jgi:alkylated DNA repair dioxygenase AlkB